MAINVYISRVIALLGIKYSGRVYRNVNHDLGGASQPFAKITFDLEPCMTMLLEKLRTKKATNLWKIAVIFGNTWLKDALLNRLLLVATGTGRVQAIQTAT